jgi:SAM-dependent methyltransferase
VSDPYETNRHLWDRWTEIHAGSKFYDVDGFLRGEERLDPIVLELLGDLREKRLLHLQCHFGLDTLCLARRGAVVTGVDFSEKAIATAKEIAARADLEASFLRSSIEDLPRRLEGEFDVVFSSWGVLPWLGDLWRWADVVAHFLAPGGTFRLAEAHPFTWIFDDERMDDRLVPVQSYFAKGPTLWPGTGTYAEVDAPVDSDHYEWMHTVSDVLAAIRAAGLRIESFVERPECAYRALSFVEEGEDGLWSAPEGSLRLPLSFTLVARR